MVVPGTRVGPITATTSEDDLIRLYGREHVARRPIIVADGESRPGTIVLGRTPDALEVLWSDDAFLQPERVIIGGGKTRWKSPEGVTVGTTLDELTKLNGRPFTFLGFGWEDGGMIVSWNGGRLGRSWDLGSTARIRLGTDRGFDHLTAAEQHTILGDREVSSSNPIVAALGVRIWEIVLLFR